MALPVQVAPELAAPKLAAPELAAPDLAAQAAAVRRFNRFYTRQIGVLEEGLLDSGLTLTEARVLYELANREGLTAATLCRELGLDQGYLSRILARFRRQGLLARTPLPGDRRQSVLSLTKHGREVFAPMDRASQSRFAAMLAGLQPAERYRLLQAMASVEQVLARTSQDKAGAEAEDAGAANVGARAPAPVRLRAHRVGDIGWIIHRQAALYALEYGWDAQFEALLAKISAGFLQRFDPAREACWVAEQDGAILGAVFLVQARAEDTDLPLPDTGQLRMLYVEPQARGMGIGHLLVDACIRRAREIGYARMTLWTNDILHAARRIYERAGFRLTAQERHHSFGKDLVGQFWELDLRDGGP